MKILVTGGAGFIASNICDAYVADGHEVIIVDNLITGKKQNLNKKARFYKVDIRDKKKLESVFKKENPQIVNHHAAQIDIRKALENPAYDADVNILGTINLLELCVKYKVGKVIFPSSGGAVYGELVKIPADESHPIKPISPYGITKFAVEKYLYYYHVTYGLKFTVLRYGNVYGPRQDPMGDAGVISIFIGKLKQAQAPFIFGDGEQLRDYVFVGDIVEVNRLALKKGDNEVFNIGTGFGGSVNLLFKELAEILKFLHPPLYQPPRPGEIYTTYLDAKKAKNILGWEAKVSIKEGLKRTVAYFSK